MATANYLTNRKRYGRPQAVLWSNNAGTLDNGLYVPTGYEINAVVPEGTDSSLIDQFLILSDHNRKEISFNTQRIEQRQRTINGRMRSYHIADKLTLNFSYTNLPSRSAALPNNFGFDGKNREELIGRNLQHTTDGGAGGIELLDWYEKHQGSFWCYLAYDKYSVFGKDDSAYAHLPQYNQLIEVFFKDFNYTVTKRGEIFDLWNVTIGLEEA